MSNVTHAEQEFLNMVWHQLHEQGRTQDALALAKNRLLGLSLENRTDFFRELILMAMVLSKSLAKRAPTVSDFHTNIKDSTRFAFTGFPLAKEYETAEQEGNAWDSVMGSVSAQIELLRHLLDLVELLNIFPEDPELFILASQLQTILQQPQGPENLNRARLISLIERGTSQEATRAYVNFIQVYGPGGEVEQLSESIVVSARFFARMVGQQAWGRALKALRIILQVVLRHPSHFNHTVESLKAVAPELFKRTQLRRRLSRILRGSSIDKELQQLITELKDHHYFGLGHNQVVELDARDSGYLNSDLLQTDLS